MLSVIEKTENFELKSNRVGRALFRWGQPGKGSEDVVSEYIPER